MCRQNRLFSFAFGIVLAGYAGPLFAQNFPGDAAYQPWPCGGGVMTDRVGDTPGAVGDADLVGQPPDPTGLRAVDAQFLYLRLRLDDDASAGGAMLKPHAWGLELDLDGNLTNYEVLIGASGVSTAAGEVNVWRNTATTMPNTPADPADAPAVQTYTFAQNGRTRAASSNEGGNADFFVDVAIPWADLNAVGVMRNTPVTVWAGTSSASDSLNLDIACHDGASGPPRLDGIRPGRTVLDPVIDTDGDTIPDAIEVQAGSNPNDPNSRPATGAHTLEGGLGCSVSGAGRAPGLAVWLVAALLFVAARRRTSPPREDRPRRFVISRR